MLSSDHRLHVVVPARYGSQRLPGKPLIDLAGTPMIVRVYDKVRAALGEVDVVVAVDDDRILQVLQSRSIPAAMTSPECESGTDRAAEVARQRGWHSNDIVVNVQGDEPLLPADLLHTFTSNCMLQQEFTMSTVSVPVQSLEEVFDPNVVKVVSRRDGFAVSFSRAPIPFDRDRDHASWVPSNYRRHVGIYAYSNSTLQLITGTAPCELEMLERLEQLRAIWLGVPISVLDWHESPPGGVDTALDAQRVIAVLQGEAQ